MDLKASVCAQAVLLSTVRESCFIECPQKELTLNSYNIKIFRGDLLPTSIRCFTQNSADPPFPDFTSSFPTQCPLAGYSEGRQGPRN